MDFIGEFQRKTGHRYLTNINTLDNIVSIMQYGLLSHEQARKIEHKSLALESVQEKRHCKKIPNGLNLHQYASLYISPRNPMMYYLMHHPDKTDPEKMCILLIAPEVLSLQGVVMTDGNAASNITRFYSPEEGLETLNFIGIHATWWTDEDPIVQEERSRTKCAEVLIPHAIPYDMIKGAVVPSEKTRIALDDLGFDKEITVHPYSFFL